jgi:hypothetical protein
MIEYWSGGVMDDWHNRLGMEVFLIIIDPILPLDGEG